MGKWGFRTRELAVLEDLGVLPPQWISGMGWGPIWKGRPVICWPGLNLRPGKVQVPVVS